VARRVGPTMSGVHRTSAQAMRIVAILCMLTLPVSVKAVRCSICEATLSDEMGSPSCLTAPPTARDCGRGHDYCINVAKYTNDGDLMSLTRSCSPFHSAPTCVPGVERDGGRVVQLCYSTCDRSGCNGSRTVHHLLDLLRRRRRK